MILNGCGYESKGSIISSKARSTPISAGRWCSSQKDDNGKTIRSCLDISIMGTKAYVVSFPPEAESGFSDPLIVHFSTIKLTSGQMEGGLLGEACGGGEPTCSLFAIKPISATQFMFDGLACDGGSDECDMVDLDQAMHTFNSFPKDNKNVPGLFTLQK